MRTKRIKQFASEPLDSFVLTLDLDNPMEYVQTGIACTDGSDNLGLYRPNRPLHNLYNTFSDALPRVLTRHIFTS